MVRRRPDIDCLLLKKSGAVTGPYQKRLLPELAKELETWPIPLKFRVLRLRELAVIERRLLMKWLKKRNRWLRFLVLGTVLAVQLPLMARYIPSHGVARVVRECGRGIAEAIREVA